LLILMLLSLYNCDFFVFFVIVLLSAAVWDLLSA
jgi:hypothetical protein